MSGLPLILHYDGLYNCCLIYHNLILIEMKGTINVMAWIILKPSPSPVHGNIISHKTGPWCQKGWGPLIYRIGNQKLKVAAEKELGIRKEFNPWLSFLLLSSRNLQGHPEPTDKMDTLLSYSSPHWVLHMISMILFLALWNIIMVCKEPDL